MFRRRFSTSAGPLHYPAIAFGSSRYPVTLERKAHFSALDTSAKDSGLRFPTRNDARRVLTIFAEESESLGILLAPSFASRREQVKKNSH
jgi:hypothetical protein